MSLSNTAEAVLLLTSRFSETREGESAPLTPSQWGRFARWLQEQGIGPSHLLQGSISSTLDGWTDSKISTDRISELLGRGSALAIAMEKWERAGIWVLTRGDDEYPNRLKARLGEASPPLLFGVGNQDLLALGGLSVVGSRAAPVDDLAYSGELGRAAAEQGFSVVSGAARGVDERAMLGALDAEGTVIGVLAHGLLPAAISSKYRDYIVNRNLVLLSPFHPEAGFNSGNLMQRNKYIYCLGDAAAVVYSGPTGGTWNGALECLKKGWVPVWLKRTDDPGAGNAGIVEKGGKWLEDQPAALDVAGLMATPGSEAIGELFSYADESPRGEGSEKVVAESSSAGSKESAVLDSEQSSSMAFDTELDFYHFALLKFEQLCAHEARNAEELSKILDVAKGQLNIWLKRATDDGCMTKLKKPVRYVWKSESQSELPM